MPALKHRTSLLAVTLVLGFSLVACGSDEPATPAGGGSATNAPSTESSDPSASADAQTFEGHGVSFRYPADWETITESGNSASQGTQAWSETFGIDGANLVMVAEYSINIPITAGNIDQHSEELTNQIEGLFTQAGGSIQQGPTKLTMAGFPALGYSGTVVNPQAVSVRNRILLAFNDTTEYFVNCQSTTESADVVDAGCEQVITTFALT
jgi:hypothetical protein